MDIQYLIYLILGAGVVCPVGLYLCGFPEQKPETAHHHKGFFLKSAK